MGARTWRSFDWLLLLSAVLLVGVGIALIHSATLEPSGVKTSLWEDLVFRQSLYGVIGLLLMAAVSAVDYRFYQNFSRLIYLIGLGLLAMIFVIGQTNFGAKSWFDLQIIPLQPSELVKVILILILAKYFSDNQESIQNPLHLALSLAFVGVPVALVYLQPDMGTAMILVATWLGMAWTAGIAIWQFGLLGLGGALAAPAVWLQLKPYMRDRILAFLNPAQDPSGESYNVIQALISIGSGGLWGKGFLQGTQTQLHFLRVRHTDFIFSVFAEEFGFVGSLVLFALFAILLWRVLRAAALARDGFGRLIACGVATMIFAQVFINLAVNLNVLPATGLPLPFISYGGSSLLTMFIGLGLVESVVMRHKSLEFE
jgi:rod shape determining protein RodA